jgi:hypothetical protein
MNVPSIVSWVLGYDSDADTYAANATAQWRILKEQFTNPPTIQWQNLHASFLANYGPPAATEDEMYARARNAYLHGIDNALEDGFMTGIKTFPADLAAAVANTAGSFLSGIPGWVKLAAIGVGVVVVIGQTAPVVRTLKRMVKVK